MASHDGNKKDSGRPAGTGNKATSELKLNLSELAREYTKDALGVLVEVMQSSQSDSARIAADTLILDRGYGRPKKPCRSKLTYCLFLRKSSWWHKLVSHKVEVNFDN